MALPTNGSLVRSPFSQEMEKEKACRIPWEASRARQEVACITSTHFPWPELSSMATSNYKEAGKQTVFPGGEGNGFNDQQVSVCYFKSSLSTKNHRTLES